MKILAINGSHRGDKGHTRFLVDKLFKGASEAGADCECIDLIKHTVKPCLSCGKCNSPDQYLKCVYEDKDDVASIFEKMAEADIHVYATPIYIFTMTSLLKVFLERMYARGDVFDLLVTRSNLVFHHIDRDICAKPFVGLVCCDNVEKETPKNVISFFKTYARFNDTEQVGLLVRNAGRFAGHGQNPEAITGNPLLARAYEAFERAGRELATEGRINRVTEKAAAANIIPMPPIIKLLRRFKPIKEKMVSQARAAMKYQSGAI